MSNTVIKAEGISKLYRLGQVGTGTLSHDLNRWWARIRGKEDPFKKIGSVNDRTVKGSSDYVWALKDISFDIQKGDAIAIVGKNGAGKSTLLKILSRTTLPTEGTLKVKGRIASLLEVGTGFHPEMTGRENIYQNGAILGMTRREIKSKFDEIVDFAGVDRYVDTPVKRYSSGMYVRLAFAVAAHLEPEILVVDEVLAVGDAEFQKKCLGKMKDVSVNDGRTVIFVSHNMEAVQTLCTKGILLKNGQLMAQDTASNIVQLYLKNFISEERIRIWEEDKGPGNEFVRWRRVEVVKDSPESVPYYTNDDIKFKFEFKLDKMLQANLDITYHLYDERGILVYVGTSAINNTLFFSPGIISAEAVFPKNILNQGTYSIKRLFLVKDKGQVLFEANDVISFEVLPAPKSEFGWMGAKEGVIFLPDTQWQFKNTQL